MQAQIDPPYPYAVDEDLERIEAALEAFYREDEQRLCDDALEVQRRFEARKLLSLSVPAALPFEGDDDDAMPEAA